MSDEIFNCKNEELNFELNNLNIKKAALNRAVKINKEKIYNYLYNLKKNINKIEIKQSLIQAFIHRIEVSSKSVKIYVKEIPMYMENYGGDDGN